MWSLTTAPHSVFAQPAVDKRCAPPATAHSKKIAAPVSEGAAIESHRAADHATS
ncbi:hypothetical protein [Burkholderia gladioli]|uniref:hypothetical protein n=1 Tax=Burkholderia gladioli TaxID=28095 RepID=UPI00039C9731